jgi:hypothetical protein
VCGALVKDHGLDGEDADHVGPPLDFGVRALGLELILGKCAAGNAL